MARLSDAFEMAWKSLSGTSAESGWRTIALDPAGSISIHAGRRFPENQEAMLVRFPTAVIGAVDKLPDGRGFSVERVDPKGDGHTWLALACKSQADTGRFCAMACEVAGALDAAASEGASERQSMRMFLGRVRAWQEFMRKGRTGLPAEEEIGLAGELTMLASIIDAGAPEHAALEGWVGPLDALQDFALGTGAIEVKTTLAPIGFVAGIVSLEQLDDAVLQPLFVAAVRLRQTEHGSRLPDLVSAMRSRLAADHEAARLLSERLIAAGYFDSDADRYERRFEAGEPRLIEVGQRFPRLVRGNVPAGVIQARYEVDLDGELGDLMDTASALGRLGVI